VLTRLTRGEANAERKKKNPTQEERVVLNAQAAKRKCAQRSNATATQRNERNPTQRNATQRNAQATLVNAKQTRCATNATQTLNQQRQRNALTRLVKRKKLVSSG
jgi:hypothetical protein